MFPFASFFHSAQSLRSCILCRSHSIAIPAQASIVPASNVDRISLMPGVKDAHHKSCKILQHKGLTAPNETPFPCYEYQNIPALTRRGKYKAPAGNILRQNFDARKRSYDYKELHISLATRSVYTACVVSMHEPLRVNICGLECKAYFE